MKRRVFSLGTLILALATALAGAEPTVQVTVRNFEDLSKAGNRLVGAVHPKAQLDCAQLLSAQLGLKDSSAFDKQRPWQIAVWYESAGGSPLIAVKGPITNINGFKESLSPEGLLGTQGKQWSQLQNGMAAIIFKSADALSETEASALGKWKAEAIQAPKKTFELRVCLSEAARAQAKGAMTFARAMFTQTMSSNPAMAATGTDPKALAEMFNAYFDLIDTFVEGFDKLALGLDVTPDALLVEKQITARAGSELARWMQPPADHVTAADLSGLDPEALIAVAGYLGKNDSLVKILQRFTALSFQMQNAGTNDLISKDLGTLFARMLPVKFTGSATLKDQLAFSGTYTFPGGDAAQAYAQMKRLFTESLKPMVGEGKVYSAAKLVEKHHTVNGVPVDRFSLAMNLDSPMFQLPGQKDQIESMFPGGKLEFDYALKDGKLLVASAPGTRMQDLLEGKTIPKGSFELEKSACLAGYFNLLDAIKRFTQPNPALPDKVKEKLARLEPQKTAIEFQVSLDNQMRTTARVPMKLLREFGRMNGTP